MEDNVFKVSSRINSTWGGNLADMVRSTKIIEIMKKYQLVRNAEKMGSIIVEFLNEMHDRYPKLVVNPRGKGTPYPSPCRKGSSPCFSGDLV